MALHAAVFCGSDMFDGYLKRNDGGVVYSLDQCLYNCRSELQCICDTSDSSIRYIHIYSHLVVGAKVGKRCKIRQCRRIRLQIRFDLFKLLIPEAGQVCNIVTFNSTILSVIAGYFSYV